MIYFVEGIGSGMVKIGYVKGSVEDRLRSIKAGCPFELRLLASCRGTLADERRMHTRFSAKRVRGEWFRLEGRLAETIKRIGIADQSAEELVADITVKAVDVFTWRLAKIAQLQSNVTMAEWLESAIMLKIDSQPMQIVRKGATR